MIGTRTRAVAMTGLAIGLAAGLAAVDAAPASAQPAAHRPANAPANTPTNAGAAPAQATPPGPAAATAPATEAGVTERDVVDLSPSKGIEIALVDVDNRLGDVRIEGHDQPGITIHAFKRAPDEETLERLKVALIPDPTGPVRIDTSLIAGRESRPIPAGSIRIDLVIRAPRNARVAARVWKGQLAVAGMENGAELSANEGSIDVKNSSGRFVSRLASGKQHYLEVFGQVDAQGVVGDMDLDVIRGERLDANVHEGSIDGRKVRVREVTLRATRGDIRFHGHAMAGGRYKIGTYRGNIEVRLGPGAPLTVWAKSRGGRVMVSADASPTPTDDGAVIGKVARERLNVRGGAQAPAMVELRSSVGNIQFAVIE